VEKVRAVKGAGVGCVRWISHGRLAQAHGEAVGENAGGENALFIEEPLLSEHLEGIKQLAAGGIATPIALGERAA
jgi:galactonate dehydratase